MTSLKPLSTGLAEHIGAVIRAKITHNLPDEVLKKGLSSAGAPSVYLRDPDNNLIEISNYVDLSVQRSRGPWFAFGLCADDGQTGCRERQTGRSYRAVILGIIAPRIVLFPAVQNARLLEENLFQPRKHPLRGGSL